MPAQSPALLALVAPSGGRQAELEPPPLDFDLLARAVRSDSYLYQAVTKYVDLIFKEGWDLRSKDLRALEYVRNRLRFAGFATGTPFAVLLQSIAEDLIVYGNAFLLKARKTASYRFPVSIKAKGVLGLQPVVGYFVLPVSTIQIERDARGMVSRYAQVVPGETKPRYLRKEDVVHFAWKPPRGEVYGYPFLLTALDDARMLRKIEDELLRLIHIHTYPLVYLQVGKDAPGARATQAEIDELREKVRNWSPEEMLILTERHNLNIVGAQGHALNLAEYLRYAEHRLFTALGVPETVMGRGQTANRATADILAAQMHDVVKSYQRLLSLIITHHVLTELLYEGGFDPLVHPEQQVELVFREIAIDERIKQENHAVFKYEHNAITFQEMRYALGMDPEVDEEDMYLARHQIPLAMLRAGVLPGPGPADTDNRNRPSNQHGTKLSPKRTTGSRLEDDGIQEAAFTTSAVQPRISVVGRELRRLWQRLGQDLEDLAKASDPAVMFLLGQELALTRDAMLQEIRSGLLRAMQDGARGAGFASAARAALVARIEILAEQDLLRLFRDLEDFFRRAVEASDASIVREGIAALDFRLDRIADFRVRQAYHAGVLAALAERGFRSVQIRKPRATSCERCRTELPDSLDLTGIAADDPLAVLPLPLHPDCDCYMADPED